VSLVRPPTVSQEREVVANRSIVRTAVVAALVIVAAVLVSTRLLRDETARLPAAPTVTPAAAPRAIGVIEQTLLSRPGGGLLQREREEAALRRYAWVDEAHERVRIPIDRAISLYVERHAASDAGVRP